MSKAPLKTQGTQTDGYYIGEKTFFYSELVQKYDEPSTDRNNIQKIVPSFPDEGNSKGTQTSENEEDINDKKKSALAAKSLLKSCGWFALKTAVISGTVLGGVAIAVPALGFTAGGVAAGSAAAIYQSTVLGGTIASGSAFAVLQSVGAAGLAASTQAGIVAASAAVSGVHTSIKEIFRKKR